MKARVYPEKMKNYVWIYFITDFYETLWYKILIIEFKADEFPKSHYPIVNSLPPIS